MYYSSYIVLLHQGHLGSHLLNTVTQSHSHTGADLAYFQSDNIVKALLEMWLHCFRVLTLSQYLQQVIIGQEVEPREYLPFGLQVHVQ